MRYGKSEIVLRIALEMQGQVRSTSLYNVAQIEGELLPEATLDADYTQRFGLSSVHAANDGKDLLIFKGPGLLLVDGGEDEGILSVAWSSRPRAGSAADAVVVVEPHHRRSLKAIMLSFVAFFIDPKHFPRT